MTSRNGRKTWAGEIPIETLNALKEESKTSDLPMWKIVDQSIRMYLGIDEGSTEAALERQLEDAKDQLTEFEQEEERIQNEREQLREQIDLLSDQLENVRQQKATHRERLDSILENLDVNPNQTVMAYMSDIREAATEEYGRDTKDNISRVIEDLRSRRDELEVQIPDHQFQRTGPTVTSDAGTTADGGQNSPNMRLLSMNEDDAP